MRYLKPITATVLLSVLLHLMFWGGLSWHNHPLSPIEKKDEEIEIVVLDPPKPPVEKAKQIVEQTHSTKEEEPEEAKYLSAKNQKVKKETRAAKTGDFNNRIGQNQPRPHKVQSRPKTLKKSFQAARPKPTQKKTEDPKGTLSILKDFTPKIDMRPKVAQETPRPPPPQGNKGREGATRDYLKNKEKGIQTLLNTREFAYYSYYHRIRKKIQLFWEPAIKKKVQHIFATGRRISSTQDRITKVIIVLNHQGQLVKVQILGESGIQDLDDAAIEAFRAAEPFPNPPKGMAEKDGKIRIRWDFILEV